MKLGSDSSFVLSFTFTLSLTVSPILAENPQASNPIEGNQAQFTAGQPALKDMATNADGVASISVAALVLPALPLTGLGPPFLNVAASPIPEVAPASAPKPADSAAPGKTKWVIIATIIGTAAVVGAILLLRGIGDSDAGPVGTILIPGTPSVNSPNR
jgi:hypothetical protein